MAGADFGVIDGEVAVGGVGNLGEGLGLATDLEQQTAVHEEAAVWGMDGEDLAEGERGYP